MRRVLLGVVLLASCGGSSPSAAEPCGRVKGEAIAPTFDGADARRTQVKTRLAPLLDSCPQVTELVAVPGHDRMVAVLQKTGELRLVDLDGGGVHTLADLEVRTRSEQGLLGLAFHPKFAKNGVLFLHTVVEGGRAGLSRVQRYTVDPSTSPASWTLKPGAIVLEQDQPYANHDAGQIHFGPDGFLYVGFGDGGSANDPMGAGQDGTTWLGAMLRLDVNHPAEGLGYGIPADNPYVGNPAVKDEIWAMGLRNPWRFSFAPDGRMVVGDVGQNAWEEVSIVEKGANLGWNVREGRHCFQPASGCATEGLIDPIYEYGHGEGVSITGGYVWTAASPAALKDHYVFGDFGTGRIWAVPLPDGIQPVEALALGHYGGLNLSTFGRLADGTLLVADYSGGLVYTLEAP